MKHASPRELESISKIFDAVLSFTDKTAKLDFGSCGFESKEKDKEGNYFCFQYYGNPKKKKFLIDVMFELKNVGRSKVPLTIRAARRLKGRKIKIGYYNMEEIYTIQIKGIQKKKQETRLLYRPEINGELSASIQNDIVEQNGAFTKGAEPMFIDEIIDMRRRSRWLDIF